VIAQLEDTFRCIAYDHRGWGESDAPADGYRIADLAKDAEGLIRQLGDMLVAASRPKGLKGLVLVAPAPPTPQDIPEDARQKQIHAYDNRRNVEEAIAFLTSRPPDAETLEQLVEDSLRGASEAKYGWPHIAAYEDISTQIATIAIPTLVIAGEEDRQDLVEQHRRQVISRIRGSRLEIIPASGHLVLIDQPIQLANSIRRFVDHINRLHSTTNGVSDHESVTRSTSPPPFAFTPSMRRV
jgi:3-oxoadipate enol-lactonase